MEKNNPITTEEAKKLLELAGKATQGEWGILHEGESNNYVVKCDDNGSVTHYVCEGVLENDLPFIASANPLTISLLVQSYLESVERLQGVLNSDVVTTAQFNDYSESISKAKEFLGRMG